MKALLIIIALAVGCAGLPSDDQVAAAEAVIAAADAGDASISPEELAAARAVLAAAGDGWSWGEVAIGVTGILLGTPLLGPRGWRIAAGALRSLRAGRIMPAISAVPALIGASSSQPIIEEGAMAKARLARARAALRGDDEHPPPVAPG